MMRWQLLTAAFVGGLIWNIAARADQAFEIVQLVCAPDTKYFSADRHYVYDLGPPPRLRSEFAALVLTESLEKQPFDCAWGSHHIEVTAFKVDVANPRGPCPSEYGDSVEIMLDGQHADCLEGAATKFDDHRANLTLVEEGIPAHVGDFILEHCSANTGATTNYGCATKIISKK